LMTNKTNIEAFDIFNSEYGTKGNHRDRYLMTLGTGD
jgi:hypothetical protein